MNQVTLKTRQRLTGGLCTRRPSKVLKRRPCKAADSSKEQETKRGNVKPTYINEYKAWGVRVIESDEALPPPQDTIEPDLWEGENMEKLGSFFEKFFLPVLVVLGLVIGGVAAGTYNDGADVFQTPASPDGLPSLVPADQVLQQ